MTDRRQRGTGSVHQRPNGSWCGQVDLGVVNGRRQRKTVYGKTEREVQRKVRDLYRQLDEHGDLPTSDATVEKWLTHWLTTIAARRLKPNTYRSYKTAVEQHIVPAIGKRRLSKLSIEHVEAMHAYITDTKELSSTTALNAHRILSIALNDAVKRNRVHRNIARLTPPPRPDESKRSALTRAEAVKVLTAARPVDPRLGSRWLMAFLTGCRQGERLGLRWSHVDLDTGTADLSWALQRVPWRHGCTDKGGAACGEATARRCPARALAIPKGMAHEQLHRNLVLMRPKTTASIRVMPLLEPLRLALEQRLAQVEAERPGYAADHDLVWCREDGLPLDPKADWQAWCDLLVAAGVRKVTGHEARHTAATLLMEAGVDRRVITETMGHSSALTTEGYKHVSLDLQRGALGHLARELELTTG
jgi:integrase